VRDVKESAHSHIRNSHIKLISGKVVENLLLSFTVKIIFMSAQKLMIATLTGIVVGILIAPAKGSETRQKLSESADNIKNKIRRLRGTTNEELDELHQVFEQEIAGLKDDIREKILRLIEVSKKGYNHVKAEALS
jgi:gas vesicle protein